MWDLVGSGDLDVTLDDPMSIENYGLEKVVCTLKKCKCRDPWPYDMVGGGRMVLIYRAKPPADVCGPRVLTLSRRSVKL